MLNKLIAIAAIAMAPSLASAQSTGGTGGSSTGGNSGGQSATQTNSASSGGSTASNPPRTEQQRRHDSLVTQMRNQRADTGNVQQFNGALSDTTDTTRRDTTRSDTSMMMNRSDTSTMNRSDTSMMNRPDTSMNRTDTTMSDTARSRLHPESTTTDTGTTTVESHGGLYTPGRSRLRGGMRSGRSANMGLSTDQVKELQQAINNAGCHAGPVDGIIGHKTREGIACVRQEKGIQGHHMNDVLSALGLGFTASPMDTTRASDTTMSRDTSSEYPRSTTTNPTDTTMNPMNPMHQTDTTLTRPDTSRVRR
ncbi:MAG TPA: peptidoglycan-binding domain-containing protein [Gemmatimonadaceae bacterium]|nr:peptidoglycan-binding domain-containing protein [Gemmatimonadaceae bacterium]